MLSKNLKFVEDILYYDGPLISKFQEKESFFIAFALSLGGQYERFALVNSEQEDVKDFENGNIDLLELLKVSKSIIIFETVNVYDRETWINFNETSFERMDSKDLPSEGLYMDKEV